MRINGPVRQVLADIEANKTPSPSLTHPSVTQSLLKRGLILRSRDACGFSITANGKNVLAEAQKGKL